LNPFFYLRIVFEAVAEKVAALFLVLSVLNSSKIPDVIPAQAGIQ